MVMFAFRMYLVDRKNVFKSISEADRVLRHGGNCAIYDFETPIPFVRENKHTPAIKTYKQDLAELLLPYGYTLVEKKDAFSGNRLFCKECSRQNINADFLQRVSGGCIY